MNIFVLSESPFLSAQLQCDRHVVKMIVESAQMLSTAHRVIDGEKVYELSKNNRRVARWKLNDEREEVLYKACHVNHPCSIWVRECNENYHWLYSHFVALCDEYTYRYGKIHASRTKLESILENKPNNITKKKHTPFALATGGLILEDAVSTYREYYKTKKDRFAMIWTKREVPTWFA